MEFDQQPPPQYPPLFMQPLDLMSPENSTDVPKSKRILVACVNCRRAKRKCQHNGSPPCTQCENNGTTATCIFPERGTSLQDRAPRGLRQRKRKSEASLDGILGPSGPHPPSQFTQPPPPSEWLPNAALPPADMLREACDCFFSQYYQTVFIHKVNFLNVLASDPSQIDEFLLLAILCVSARFSDRFRQQYGGPLQASQAVWARVAPRIMDEITAPSVVRIQSFYLLAIAAWSNGETYMSSILTNIAQQMAEDIKLSSVNGPTNIDTESCRRTWWYLFSTNGTAINTTEREIPLPSHEIDYAYGSLTPDMYLTDVFRNPKQCAEMSLGSVLLSSLAIFGNLTRRLGAPDEDSNDQPPWTTNSIMDSTVDQLKSWIQVVTNRQKWSLTNLLAHQATQHGISFYTIWVAFHVCHMTMRRPYLPTMISALNNPDAGVGSIAGQYPPSPSPREWWRQMAEQMVDHATHLIDMAELYATHKNTLLVCATPFIGFGLYLAGSIMSYVPWLCPDKLLLAVHHRNKAIEMLMEGVQTFPVIHRWLTSLRAQANFTLADSATTIDRIIPPPPGALENYRSFEERSMLLPPVSSFDSLSNGVASSASPASNGNHANTPSPRPLYNTVTLSPANMYNSPGRSSSFAPSPQPAKPFVPVEWPESLGKQEWKIKNETSELLLLILKADRFQAEIDNFSGGFPQ